MKKIMAFLGIGVLLSGVVIIYTNCQSRLQVSGGNNSGTGLTAYGPASVYQYHNQSTRNGVYTDATMTKAASAGLHLDTKFTGTVTGNVYAQPLYLDGNGGQDLIIVATEQNHVTALSATDGHVVWDKTLGTPVPLSSLPCGNIDPLGITGTPVVDPSTHTLYVDAMTTPDGGTTKKHLIYALSADDGSTKSGWPLDVSAKVKTSTGLTFDSTVQNERGALVLLNNYLYVPYGGHDGDCGNYHGWVVAVPVNNPSGALGWATTAALGGIWAPSGLASDGHSVFAVTGNTNGATTWGQGESVLRITPPDQFSGQTQDYYAPPNWQALDSADLDLGGSGINIFNAPGATPSNLSIAFGKDGNIYLLNTSNLGGISSPLAMLNASSAEIRSASTAYTTSMGTYVAFNNMGSKGCPSGQSGDLMAVKISKTNPPQISVAWCAQQNGQGAPITTTTDGTNQAIVWSVGAEGDNRLHGFDGDTGQVVFNGGAASDQMTSIQHFQTVMEAKGHIYVPANNKIYSFTLN